MISRIYSAGLFGIDGFLVTVECSAWDRIPCFDLVGLPDAAVKEAKNRVRSACENSGFTFPPLDLCVNLAPASMKKEGTAFDLAILISVLQCQGIVPHAMDFSDKMLIGELSLTGEVRRVDGVLPMCVAARDSGKREVYVPIENVGEAAVVDGIEVYGVKNLRALINHLLGKERIEKTPRSFDPKRLALREGEEDFSEVRGQLKAKRALEIAAAGGHNVLMIGPPGSGKSMLAKRLGSILPDMTFEEAITATKIHSVMGTLKSDLICTRPFRAPHHTVSPVGMIGGGQKAQPGEISLAQSGVLFLDELPEFPKKVTESLRQPLEDGVVTITRAAAKMTYPSRFMLVCAMNPCSCGYFGDPNKQCTCSPAAVRKYLDRISGPLLDRMDLIIELPSVSYDDISGNTPKGESSAAIRERVNRARAFAASRMSEAGDDPTVLNASMSPAQLQKHCVPSVEARELMREAFDSLGLSARGHDRILRVARTIADLDGAAEIDADHIGEAIMYRSLDRKYWKR
jgi:magnesium chelatase family protein